MDLSWSDASGSDAKPVYRAARRGRAARGLLIALAVMAGVALVLAVSGLVLVRHYEGQITRVNLAAPAGLSSAAQNVLLVGSDTRIGVGGGFGRAAVIAGQRSDTVILAHLPDGSAKPTLVSFPRDSYVQIPAYTDARGMRHAAGMNKLNTAYADGGPQLLVDTIHHLTGLRIDHYVEVNFAGFERMVNALGGVTLCARTTRHDPANGANGGSNDFMTAGVHRNVSGAVALAFVRDRHSFPDQDISRIRDQQYFLAQMMRKVLSVGTLTNPFKLNAFLDAATKSLRVDQGLSLAGLRTLAERLRHTDPAHVRFVTAPFTTSSGYATIAGVAQSVVLLDPSADRQLFESLAGPTAPVAAQLAPGEVSVRVLNATHNARLARQVAARIRALGFHVSAVGSAAPTATTSVRYPPADSAAARTLAAAVAGSPQLVADPAAGGVTLLLGRDFRGVHITTAPSGGHTPAPVTSAASAPAWGRALGAADLSCGA